MASITPDIRPSPCLLLWLHLPKSRVNTFVFFIVPMFSEFNIQPCILNMMAVLSGLVTLSVSSESLWTPPAFFLNQTLYPPPPLSLSDSVSSTASISVKLCAFHCLYPCQTMCPPPPLSLSDSVPSTASIPVRLCALHRLFLCLTHFSPSTLSQSDSVTSTSISV